MIANGELPLPLQAVVAALRANAREAGAAVIEHLRLEYGVPCVGADIDSRNARGGRDHPLRFAAAVIGEDVGVRQR